MSEFNREWRYIVIKRKHLEPHHEEAMLNFIYPIASPIDCVVVEDDWPEYELVWKLIENRVTGKKSPSIEEIMKFIDGSNDAD